MDLARVDDAEGDFWSWNLKHGLGGFSLQCTECEDTYTLGARVTGQGLPDLIPVDTLGQIPRVELTPLQRRTLDISLVAEEALWQKSMDLVRAANLAGGLEGEGIRRVAEAILGTMQKEKILTLRAILSEHGFEGLPETLRIARTFEGSGCIYSVSRGPLPLSKKVSEDETRQLDLSPYVESPETEVAIRRTVW